MTMTAPWRLRPLNSPTDHPTIATLWRAALEPTWPLLPLGVELITDGLVAEDGSGRPVGVVGTDPAGSVQLIAVDPAFRRRGVGTALLTGAVERLRSGGAPTAADGKIRAGSGGTGYIWPGVPTDLPQAVAFFAARGWSVERTDLDLALDLAGYETPAGMLDRPAGAGISVAVASPAETTEVLAFERETFPEWVREFSVGREQIVVARDNGGEVVGSLLFAGPGAHTVYAPMLGPAQGIIGCVGVSPKAEGNGIGSAMVAYASQVLRDRGTRMCHISWTGRGSFYARVGYRPWRYYRMFRLPGTAGS